MKRGFTLLELLIVVAIIALLSSLGALTVGSQRKKANDARRRTDIHELQVALEAYRVDHQLYPSFLPASGQPLTSPDSQTTYLSKMPADPLSRDPYLYTYWATPAANPAAYIVCAYRLEAEAGSFCLTNRQ